MVPIQYFAANVLGEIVRRQPASKERTSFAWSLAVGPALARVTTVQLEGGVLRVHAADERWVGEIERARHAVLQKMQHLLGKDEVKKIKTRY